MPRVAPEQDPTQATKEALESLNVEHGPGAYSPHLVRAIPSVLALDEWIWQGGWVNSPNAATGGDETFALSKPVKGQRAFLSHSWSDDVKSKVAAIRMHVHLPGLGLLAVAVLVLSTVAVIIFSPLAIFLVAALVLLFWPMRFFCDKPPQALLELKGLSAPQFWLDKTCIHQGNERLRMAGIGLFDVFLEQSQQLWIMFSDKYLTRIWCVYELAVWTKNKGTKGIYLLPLDWASASHKALTWSIPFLAFTGAGWIAMGIGVCAGSYPIGPQFFGLGAGVVTLFVIGWTTAMVGQQVMTARKNMAIITEALRTFDVRKCGATVAGDKELVLGKVREAFGSEEEFNAFVKSKFLSTMKGLMRWFMFQNIFVVLTIFLIFTTFSFLVLLTFNDWVVPLAWPSFAYDARQIISSNTTDSGDSNSTSSSFFPFS
mmetsp:Transcript_29475/g.72716  ORF Transcript_29475/g.72716 Transcript_29475/m.72716 type:complete len:429 (-) Transcript_29475:246-1532(-)